MARATHFLRKYGSLHEVLVRQTLRRSEQNVELVDKGYAPCNVADARQHACSSAPRDHLQPWCSEKQVPSRAMSRSRATGTSRRLGKHHSQRGAGTLALSRSQNQGKLPKPDEPYRKSLRARAWVTLSTKYYQPPVSGNVHY